MQNDTTHAADETLAIVNPVAGRGRTRRLWPNLGQQLNDLGVPLQSVFTAGPNHARELAAEAVQSGVARIVAVGGDGTTHDVANALVGTDVTLGILPTGGGNDFCRAIGVSLNLADAVRTIAHGRSHRVDVGRLNDEYFINGLGIGLDGAASLRYRNLKRLRGELGYIWSAVREALTFRAFDARLTTDEWTHAGKALSVGASNGPYHGGDFRVAPNARADDGELDVYVMRPVAYLSRLIKLAQIRRGAHLDMPQFSLQRSRWAEIDLDRPVPAHMDGESFTLRTGRTRVEIVPDALTVLLPHPSAY